MTLIPQTTELFIDGAWVDVTEYVRGAHGVTTVRGRKDEKGRVTPTSVSLSLNNRDGRFSSKYPTSPYFGKFTKNTKLRHTIRSGDAGIDEFTRSAITNEWNTVLYTFDVDAEGWAGEGATSVARVVSPVLYGAGSLEATKTMGAGFDSLRFNDAEGARDISANGDSLAVWVLVPGGSGGTGWLAHIEVQDDGFSWHEGEDVSLTPGTWSRLTYTDTEDLFSNCRAIGIQVSATGVGGTQDVNIDTVVQYDSVTQILWQHSGGTVPDEYDTNGTHGQHTHGSANVLHYSTSATSGPDMRVRGIVKLSAGTITGANTSAWVLGRVTDTSNYYAALVSFETDGDVTIGLYKRVGGVLTNIATPITTHASYSGLFDDYEFGIELYCVGSKIYGKIWDYTNHDEVHVWNLKATDTSLTTGNGFGVADRRETGNTNANLQFLWSEVKCVPGWLRAYVEVPDVKQRFDTTGTDIYTLLQGAGVKRRLGQRSKPLRSPLYRAHTLNEPLAYWPLEDERNVDTAASGVEGVLPMAIVDHPGAGHQLGYPAVDGQPVWEEPGGYGSARMLSLRKGGQLRGIIPSSTATSFRLEFIYRYDAETDLGFSSIPTTLHNGTNWEWSIAFNSPANTVQLVAGSYDGSVVGANIVSSAFDLYDGLVHHIRLDVEQDGGDLDHELFLDGASVGTDTWSSFTLASNFPDIAWVNSYRSSGDDNPSVGHYAVYAPIPTSFPGNTVLATQGHNGELAAIRFARLCAEEDISYELVGDSSATELMGPQQISTLQANLEACEDVDMGVVFEPRHFFGLSYRTGASLYLPNQTALTLNCASNHLSEPFDDDDDDQLIRNDVELSRPGGSSFRTVQETGTLNVQDPDDDPDGVGRYDDSRQVNVYLDEQLSSLAHWLKNLGTYDDQARFSNIRVELHRSPFTASATLTASVAHNDVGDYLVVEDPISPPLPPDDLSFITEGYTERTTNMTWEIRWNTTPAGRYNVGVFENGTDATRKRYSSANSTTSGSITTGTSTSLSVAVGNTGSLWVTGNSSPEFPFDLNLLGARVRVTAVSGASSPQTFTISTTVVNGVAKTIPSGTPVRIWDEVRYGR